MARTGADRGDTIDWLHLVDVLKDIFKRNPALHFMDDYRDAYRALDDEDRFECPGSAADYYRPTNPDLNARIVIEKARRGEYKNARALADDADTVVNNAHAFVVATNLDDFTQDFKGMRISITRKIRQYGTPPVRVHRLPEGAESGAAAAAAAPTSASASPSPDDDDEDDEDGEDDDGEDDANDDNDDDEDEDDDGDMYDGDPVDVVRSIHETHIHRLEKAMADQQDKIKNLEARVASARTRDAELEQRKTRLDGENIAGPKAESLREDAAEIKRKARDDAEEMRRKAAELEREAEKEANDLMREAERKERIVKEKKAVEEQRGRVADDIKRALEAASKHRRKHDGLKVEKEKGLAALAMSDWFLSSKHLLDEDSDDENDDCASAGPASKRRREEGPDESSE